MPSSWSSLLPVKKIGGGSRTSKTSSVIVGWSIEPSHFMMENRIRESKRPTQGHTAVWDSSDLESRVPNTTPLLPDERTWRLEEVEVGVRGPWKGLKSSNRKS